MKDSDDLAGLVLRQHPAARTTYEVSEQLAEHLPITSVEHLARLVDEVGLTVAGDRLDPRQLSAVLPEGVFPIRDLEELVVKVAAAIRAGVSIMRREDRTPGSDAHTALAMELAVEEPVAGSLVATGFFGGPGLFGAERGEEGV